MRLSELQRQFAISIRCDLAPPSLPISGDGMRIYRNNYRAQLKAALEESFPHLRLWLGEGAFERAANAHITRSPPNSWTLDDYGRDFPFSLRIHFPDDAEVWELAWLELAMAQSFVAKDVEPVAAGDLHSLDWDRAHIVFVPSLRFAEATSNAADIWAALEEQSVPPRASLLPECRGYIVWQRAFVSRFRLISLTEYRLLCALHLGASFSDACQILCLSMPEEEAIIAAGEMLGRYLNDGLIARVEAPLMPGGM